MQVCQEGIVTEPETPWQNRDPLQWFAENTPYNRDNHTEIYEIKDNNSEKEMKNLDLIWENMDKISPVSSHQTWETLGVFNPPKEPPFVSELVDATIHIVNVAQDDIFTEVYF